MDPEQTFLRVHARLSGVLSQLLTARIRLVLEYVHLAFAVVLLCLLVVMHANFVQQPGCSSELSGINFTEAQLVQIKISVEQKIMNSQREDNLIDSMATPNVKTDGFTVLPTSFWSNWIDSGAKRSKLIFKSWKDEKEALEPQVEKSTDKTASKVKSEKLQKSLLMTTRESFRAVFIRFFSRWNPYISFYRRIAEQFLGSGCRIWTSAGRYVLGIPKLSKMLRIEHLKPFTVQWLASRSKAFEPTYLYTSQKGYFLLPEAAKARHHIRTINVTISAKSSCFGNRLQQLIINRLVGYDTILLNSLLNSPGQGYLYNYQTNEFNDLSYGQESTSSARFGDYFVTKCGILIMSLFVFFTTTMSVSFTLRETQSRMLWFTVQLQHHARHHLPTFQLIFVHVIESLVFVPIMMGILFFLFEFYDDQLLAFLVLALVWLCELFTMISVRTPISMQFFPRFFLLYFLAFHIYFFSFPYGFSYLAFSATLAFMQHLILYFWNRFEVPALQRFMRTRAQLQQQAGVRITSTIYTSTLQITRRNLHIANLGATELVNPDVNSEDQRVGPEPTAGPTQPTTDTVGPNDSAGAQEEVQNPQAEAAPAPGFLNPFSSFLFRILGGASSDGIVSFFSMFRVVRDQAQNYTQEQQDDNDEQAT